MQAPLGEVHYVDMVRNGGAAPCVTAVHLARRVPGRGRHSIFREAIADTGLGQNTVGLVGVVSILAAGA
jgi:hypothetical protein